MYLHDLILSAGLLGGGLRTPHDENQRPLRRANWIPAGRRRTFLSPWLWGEKDLYVPCQAVSLKKKKKKVPPPCLPRHRTLSAGYLTGWSRVIPGSCPGLERHRVGQTPPPIVFSSKNKRLAAWKSSCQQIQRANVLSQENVCQQWNPPPPRPPVVTAHEQQRRERCV